MSFIFGQSTKAVIGLTVLMAVALPAAAQDVMYVPLGSADKIVVIDTRQDAVVGTIPGIPAVHGLAGTPDGRLLIAGSFDEREEGDTPPPKPAGMAEQEHAAHHARSANGKHKAQSAISTVSVIRTADRSLLRRIDVPGAVHHVAVSPDGKRAVVTHPNRDAISAIDLDSFQVIKTTETGPLPNYAVFSPDGKQLYVSNAGNDTIAIVDARRWVVQRSVAVGGSPEHVLLSSDGRALYVNNVDDGTVSVVSLPEGKLERTIPVGAVLHGIDLSDDGETLFVSAMGDEKVVAVRLSTGVYRSVLSTPQPYHLSAVRGAGKLYVSSADQPKLWVLDQRDLKVLGEIPIGGKGHQMVQMVGG